MNTSRCSICEELGETCMECQPDIDMPPATGHAVPQWLRDQFDVIELQVRKMGAEAVFTQMRTKVQAYFEMLRSIERGRAGRDLFLASHSGEEDIKYCPYCNGEGSVGTGIAEASSTLCNACEGTGRKP
ncbi:hypothetical protein ACX3YD_22270 [Pseudomonas fluorescens group sp. PF-1]